MPQPLHPPRGANPEDETPMPYVAEIYVDHPTLTPLDQIDTLYVRKTISASDYRSLATTVRVQQEALTDPRTAQVDVLLHDGRLVKVTKYAPPEGFAPGQRERPPAPAVEASARARGEEGGGRSQPARGVGPQHPWR